MRTRVFMFLLVAMFGITAIAVGAEPVEYSEMTHMVQVRLTEYGFDPGPSDGLMGSKTRDAILRYEEQHGIPATGMVSENLLQQLGLHELHQIRNIRIRGELIGVEESPAVYCQLVDGFGKCGNAEVTIQEFMGLEDLNADAVTDIVAIFQAWWGGNSPDWYLLSALKQGSALTEISSVSISGAFSLNIDRSGKIILRDLIHRDGEPHCCPTRPVEIYYRVKNGKLAQEGTARELTRADVPTLILSLQRRTERRGAAIALGVIGGKDAVSALTRALAFKDSGFHNFHIASLQALGRIGKDAANALPTIRRSAQHDNEWVRSAAVEVIATIERTSQRENLVRAEWRRILEEAEDPTRQQQIEEDYRIEIMRMTEVVERCGDMAEDLDESMQADRKEFRKFVQCHMENRSFGVRECQWTINDILFSIQRTKDLVIDFQEECAIIRIDSRGRVFFDSVRKLQKELAELESMLEKILR